MATQSKQPNRQSIRLRGWDYTSPGWYFATINTHHGTHRFGTIINGRMVLNPIGKIAEEEWRKSGTLRANIELDEFVIMPNHVHGLVRILAGSNHRPAPKPQFGKPIAGALGTFIGAYKAAVSREINRRGEGFDASNPSPDASTPPLRDPIWQRNYWDVIVRDATALANIRRYIRENPRNYAAVMQGGTPRTLGNRALLEMPKVGFLASRGETCLHGKLALNPGEVVMSGFLSPMERALFRAGLKSGKPMIWVKPWGLANDTGSVSVRRAIEAGHLLLISPFDETIDAPSVRRAAWCNHYILAHCQRLVIGHLNPEGMLACIISEARTDLEIIFPARRKHAEFCH